MIPIPSWEMNSGAGKKKKIISATQIWIIIELLFFGHFFAFLIAMFDNFTTLGLKPFYMLQKALTRDCFSQAKLIENH